MKVNSNFFRLASKKRLVSLSCATALASFALIARPVFAEELTTDKPTISIRQQLRLRLSKRLLIWSRLILQVL
mgnify:CR=1 FL=1